MWKLMRMKASPVLRSIPAFPLHSLLTQRAAKVVSLSRGIITTTHHSCSTTAHCITSTHRQRRISTTGTTSTTFATSTRSTSTCTTPPRHRWFSSASAGSSDDSSQSGIESPSQLVALWKPIQERARQALNEGRPGEAIQHFEDAVFACKAAHPSVVRSVSIATSLYGSAEAHQALENVDQAEQELGRATNVLHECPKHPIVAQLLVNVMLKLGDLSKSERDDMKRAQNYYETARVICQDYQPHCDEQHATALLRLGCLAHSIDDNILAERCLSEAIQIKKTSHSKMSPWTVDSGGGDDGGGVDVEYGMICRAAAVVYFELGELSRCKELYLEAIAILEQAGRPELKEVADELAKVHQWESAAAVHLIKHVSGQDSATSSEKEKKSDAKKKSARDRDLKRAMDEMLKMNEKGPGGSNW